MVHEYQGPLQDAPQPRYAIPIRRTPIQPLLFNGAAVGKALGVYRTMEVMTNIVNFVGGELPRLQPRDLFLEYENLALFRVQLLPPLHMTNPSHAVRFRIVPQPRVILVRGDLSQRLIKRTLQISDALNQSAL